MSNYSIAEECREVRSSPRMDKWFKRLIFVVTGILGAELIWIFGITPLLPLSTVEVSGISGIDRSEILSRAGISLHSSYMTVNPEAAETALEELYQVESAQVIKYYPDTVRIILEPRRLAALSLCVVEGKLLPVFFDKHGVAVKIGRDVRELPQTPALPIISGLPLEEARLGTRLSPVFAPFLAQLEAINTAAPELLAPISEIRINRKTYDGFDLILYPVNNTIKFRLESNLNEDMLRYMILMIDVFKTTGVDADVVDLRTGTASYVIKGATSG